MILQRKGEKEMKRTIKSLVLVGTISALGFGLVGCSSTDTNDNNDSQVEEENKVELQDDYDLEDDDECYDESEDYEDDEYSDETYCEEDENDIPEGFRDSNVIADMMNPESLYVDPETLPEDLQERRDVYKEALRNSFDNLQNAHIESIEGFTVNIVMDNISDEDLMNYVESFDDRDECFADMERFVGGDVKTYLSNFSQGWDGKIVLLTNSGHGKVIAKINGQAIDVWQEPDKWYK